MGRHIAEGPIDAKRSGASFVERENKGRHVAGEATNSIGRTTLAQSLSVERLKAWYGRESLVLTDVSFVLEAGEAVGLIGLNGAGKTTMLTSLCDVHRGARLGSLRYRGGDVHPGNERFKAPAISASPMTTPSPPGTWRPSPASWSAPTACGRIVAASRS